MRPALPLAVALATSPWPLEPIDLLTDVPPEDRQPTGVRGVTLAPIEDQRLGAVGYGSERCDIALAEAASMGATWVSLTPFGRMDDLEDTDILHDFEIPVEANETLIERTAEQAREAGLRVALIPHVYVMSGEWRGEIDPGGEAEWAAWFASYERFVERFARLAARIRADLFSIGVEFKSSTNSRPTAWRRIIARVREIYPGPITYSANWDEVEDVEFWDDLDLIGVNAFWPLARRPGDDREVMRERAAEVSRFLESLSTLWDRPVVLTEVGTKSARDAALAPWQWPEHCTALVYDEAYQAEALEAVFEAFTQKPWFAGLFVWKLFSDPWDETQEPREGFSPRAKIAEGVLSAWFHAPWGDDTDSWRVVFFM